MTSKSQHVSEQHLTPKGFRVLNISIANYPISSSSVWINAGSSKDPIDKLGLSHFFEHLLFNETKKYPNRQLRLEEVEKNGLLFNAFTSLQCQHYFYVHEPRQSHKALELLLDGINDSVFTSQIIEREKSVIESEEKENRNDPNSYIWRLANSGLWNKQQLGKDFYGNQKTLKSISKADIELFYAAHFTSDNILYVFINSELSIDDQDQMIESCSLNLTINMTEQQQEYSKVDKSYLFEKRDMSNAQVAFSFLTEDILKRDEKIIQDLVVNYLASGWISRLIQKLRIEENLVYWVYPDSFNGQESGYIRFSLSTETQNLPRVVELFRSEIEALQNTLIRGRILDNHKFKLLSDITRSSTEYGWLMHWYGYNTLLSNEDTNIEAYKEKIQSITPDQVREFSQKYLVSDRLSCAILGSSDKDIRTIFQ
jgi:predicted Zn-dependent peptidase